MKKQLLLTAAFTMLATVGFAQVKTDLVKHQANLTPLKAEMRIDANTVKPRRSVSDGTWYSKPLGMLFLNCDLNLSSYRASVLAIPPFYQTTFKNECNTTNVTWTINGSDFSEYMDPATGDCDYYYFGRTTVDEDGMGLYYVPTIQNGKSSYTLCETDKDGEANADGCAACVPDETNDLAYGYNEMGTNNWYGQGAIKPATAVTDNDYTYIFGPGTITFSDGETWNSAGVAQVFPAPVTPLTVNDLLVHALSNTTPLTGDAVLYMEIRDVVQNSRGEDTFGDEVYETLVAYPEDCSIAYTYNNTTNYWNILFHKKSEDDFGIETNTPFILDKKFALVVSNMNQPGCDAGFMGLTMSNEDEGIILEAEPIIELDGSYASFSYTNPICLDCGFLGFFDAVSVPTSLTDGTNNYDECNILRVSPDGETVTNEKYPETFGGYVYAEFARALVDENENDNYDFDAPDWVTGIYYEELSDSQKSGMYVLTITAEPLPEGVTGRTGHIYIKGSGVTSADPIHVLQGDVTYADGIQNATVATNNVSKKAYSLSGQQVSDNFKGIVVKDGKKMIRK